MYMISSCLSRRRNTTHRWSLNGLVFEQIQRSLASLSLPSTYNKQMPADMFKKFCDRKSREVVNSINCSFRRNFSWQPELWQYKAFAQKRKKSEILSSYRSVTNLKWIGKLLEKTVHEQMRVHLDGSESLILLQSACRFDHSTEPALSWCTNTVLGKLSKPNFCANGVT